MSKQDTTPESDFRNQIFHQSIAEPWPLPKESIDVLVTSPPYWGQRDYGEETKTWWNHDSACEHQVSDTGNCEKCGGELIQLGQEDDPRDFIHHLVDSLHEEAMRTLRPDGQLWINMGDTYSRGINDVPWGEAKQRLLLPYRVAMAMQDKGWVLRSELIWAKGVAFEDGDTEGGGMPSAVHDRLNHFQEPFFGFVKPKEQRKSYFVDSESGKVSWERSDGMDRKDYYSDMNSIRLDPIWVDEDGDRTDLYGRKMGSEENAGGSPQQHEQGQPNLYMRNHPLGKNPGSVWQVTPGSINKDYSHTAPYPKVLIERIIKFASPRERCSECGLPLTPILYRDGEEPELREVECDCDADTQAGLVFDPFMGSGTTAVAAAENGRDYSGLELNAEFIEEAEERIPPKQRGLEDFS